MSVNYIIATIGDIKHRNIQLNELPAYESYLRLHLEKLLENFSSEIKQITICMPETNTITGGYYSSISEIEKKFPCPVVKIHMPNHNQSYGQWIRALEQYREFDYSILIEDDYYPDNQDFVKILIDEYLNCLVGTSVKSAYLCSLTGAGPAGRPLHARISNGILNKTSQEEILKTTNIQNFLKHATTFEIQVNFSLLFEKLADYCDRYKSIFWSSPGKTLVEYSRPTSDPDIVIFSPIQSLEKDRYRFIKHEG